MCLQRHNLVFIFFVLLVFSCKKEQELKSDSYLSTEFGPEGKSYSWASVLFTSSNPKPIELTIPAGAVNYTSFVELYQYRVFDQNNLTAFSINGVSNDFYLLRSNVTELQVPAVMKLPFYYTLNFSVSQGYMPYKVKSDDYTDLMSVLNNAANWTPITNFTFDNTTKYLSFEVTDLNAIYLIGKPK